MAPKSGRGRGSRGKPEKKKKKLDEKVPSTIDITVLTPYDSKITLKGISTDKIIDVRKLLSSNTQTCHITNYSLEHVAREKPLNDGVEIMSLKPGVLKLVEGELMETGHSTVQLKRIERKKMRSEGDRPPLSKLLFLTLFAVDSTCSGVLVDSFLRSEAGAENVGGPLEDAKCCMHHMQKSRGRKLDGGWRSSSEAFKVLEDL